MDYDYLREQYPETISMDQLYRICHISKRKAKWLLENGVIPCEDSGKQTRRFQIHLEDVIVFLERRDAGLLQEAIPAGIFSSGGRTFEQPRQILDSGSLAAFLLERWADAPDLLTVAQTASLCGYGPSAINRWVRDGLVEAVSYRGHNLIFKESLADRLASYEGQTISARSELHKELLEEFQREEQNSGMEWGSMSL
nr:helix-turn-helix domain-containing protein [uncultured Oscillibacter sp.]